MQSSPKRKKRKNKPKIRTAEHQLFDGEALLFRTPPSGNVWQFQMWIATEQKYFRKSTRSRNLDQAIVVGKDYYLDAHTKLRTAEAIFPKTVQYIVDDFLETIKKGVGINRTHGRWVTIRSQMKHLVSFVGANTRITEIPLSKWDEYYQHRRKHNPNVVNTTLQNERNTIRSFYRFAIRKRHLSPTFPLPEFPYLSREVRRRVAFTSDQWKVIYNFLRKNQWMKHDDPKVQEQRFFIRYFILFLANSGLRFGEARRLKWKNVEIKRDVFSVKEKRKISYASISLDVEQTKNRKARLTVSRRPDILEKLKSEPPRVCRRQFFLSHAASHDSAS